MPTCFDMKGETSWCPGCGNFAILNVLKQALVEHGVSQKELVVVSGIGQAAKIAHYIKANFINGLHGRALPIATGVKMANPKLTVVVVGGDGDMYAEGGNHFMHAIRRNVNIVNLVHNNMVYGLTKGQASPTSEIGFKTPIQTKGVSATPLNPVALALSLGATFVARGFSGKMAQLKDLIKAALMHNGYSYIDIFQPCISFNKVNTFKWYNDNTVDLAQYHDPNDRVLAFEKSLQTDPYQIGLFYQK